MGNHGSNAAPRVSATGLHFEPARPVLDGKTICVFGGLGSQGRAVVEALKWKHPRTSIRIVTRNPASDKAIVAAAALNITCVKADLNNTAECEVAMRSCYGAFLVTNYWAPGMDAVKEIQQTHNFYNAAKNAGVRHVVFSTLLDTREAGDWRREENETLFQDMFVPHYDGKGGLKKLFNEQDRIRTDFVQAGFYMDNFIGSMKPQGGKFVYPFGNNEQSLSSCADIGKAVAALFSRGLPTKDKHGRWPSTNVASDKISYAKMAEIWESVIGQKAEHVDQDMKTHVAMMVQYGFPEENAKDVANMYGFQSRSKTYKKGMNPAAFRKLVPDAMTFEAFLRTHKAKILASIDPSEITITAVDEKAPAKVTKPVGQQQPDSSSQQEVSTSAGQTAADVYKPKNVQSDYKTKVQWDYANNNQVDTKGEML